MAHWDDILSGSNKLSKSTKSFNTTAKNKISNRSTTPLKKAPMRFNMKSEIQLKPSRRGSKESTS